MRRCAGCGRRAPQGELLRFAARDGELVAGRNVQGRGAYTCRRLECFDRAVERRRFVQILRQPLRIEPGLRRLYTEGRDGERRQ